MKIQIEDWAEKNLTLNARRVLVADKLDIIMRKVRRNRALVLWR